MSDNLEHMVRRRPRFARQPLATIRLTEDDLVLIGAVGRHRFLRSTHLVRLLPHRSPRKIIERLGALYHAGYLDRPRAQINYFAASGSAPIVYALGNQGADALAVIGQTQQPFTDWSDKNRSVKRPYIEHALLLADLMLGLEIATRERDDIELIDEAVLRAELPDAIRNAAHPWRLTARIRHRGKYLIVAAEPDVVFALQFKSTGRRSFFFVEADRATMPITRSDITQSSFEKKLIAYLAAHKQRQHVARFGFANMRVLTLTTSAERIEAMIAALKTATGGTGSRQFLFAGRKALKETADFIGMPWTSGKDDQVTLAD